MNKILTLAVVVVFALFAAACSQQESEDIDIKNEQAMAFSASISSLESMTKVLSNSDESKINNIDILVFNSVDNTYAYRIEATDIVSNSSSIDFAVTLRMSASSDDKYFLVLLANISESDLEGADLTEGVTTLSQAAEAITFSPQSSWQSGSSIVMSARLSENVAIDSNTRGNDFGSATFTRSLARINIKNNDTEAFKLESVTVFNSLDKAYAISLISSASSPSTAAAAEAYKVAADDNAITNEIYVVEIENSALDDDKALFLVVCGSYLGQSSSYYRIDINSGGERIDLLRNSSYDIVISDIAQNGASSIEEALSSESLDDTQIQSTVWNEDNLNYIFSNGVTTLAIDTLSLELKSNGGTSYIKIKTDSEDGFEAEVSESVDWINSIVTSNDRVYIVPSVNTTGITRECTLIVSAGGVWCEVSMSQPSQ